MKESLKIFILGIIFAILAVLCRTPGPAVAQEQEIDGDNERIEQNEVNNRGGDMQPGASAPGKEDMAKPAENPVRAVGASEWQQLLDQVKELKDEVKRLRDGAEIRKKLEITEEERGREGKKGSYCCGA